MNYKLIVLLFLSVSMSIGYVHAERVGKEYTVVLPENPLPMEGHLQQGIHISPSGRTFSLNSRYYIKDGRPWYPVMGEMHYARVPQTDWKESILKMKASGVTVIATYVFWNYATSMACTCGYASARGVTVRFAMGAFPIG